MAFSTPVVVTGICVVGILCQWLAWRVRLPAILFLLLAGCLLGPIANWVNPDRLLGDLLFPFVSLSVALILFEGSLTLKFSEVRGLERVIYRMLTVGVLATWTVTAAAVRGLLDVPWGLATVFGAMTIVTGPTVIGPLLQTIRLRPSVARVLRWEGILSTPWAHCSRFSSSNG
jgi:NhaP-type Na+/H+ or K+/H+ antiporter